MVRVLRIAEVFANLPGTGIKEVLLPTSRLLTGKLAMDVTLGQPLLPALVRLAYFLAEGKCSGGDGDHESMFADGTISRLAKNFRFRLNARATGQRQAFSRPR
jgi:hypothetical protein